MKPRQPKSFLVRGNGKIQKKLREIVKCEWLTETYRLLLLTYSSGRNAYWVLGCQEEIELTIKELSDERGIVSGVFVNGWIKGEMQRISTLGNVHRAHLKGSDL